MSNQGLHQRPSVMAQARLRERGQGDPAADEVSPEQEYGGFTRDYRFLDVFSKRQGLLRMRLIAGVWFFSFFVGAWMVGIELLSLNYEDMDMRDMVDDWRNTITGIQLEHNFFTSAQSALSVSLDGQPGRGYAGNTFRAREIHDPRIDWLLPAGDIPDTEYRAYWVTLNVQVEAPVYQRKATFTATLTPSVSGTNTEVRWFETHTDWDEDKVEVRRITSLAFYTYQDRGYRVHEVKPEYSPVWTGSIAESQAPSSGLISASSGALSIAVELRDISEPKQPTFPTPTGFTRAFIGFILLFVAFGTHVWWWYLHYAIRRNAKQNTQQPPPFFAGWTRFRGW